MHELLSRFIHHNALTDGVAIGQENTGVASWLSVACLEEVVSPLLDGRDTCWSKILESEGALFGREQK